MNQRAELHPVVVKFINDWVDLCRDNKETTVGEWLYAFGAMSALAMRGQDLTKEQEDAAVEYLNQAVQMVYSHSAKPEFKIQ
jgi:hypothetical protein